MLESPTRELKLSDYNTEPGEKPSKKHDCVVQLLPKRLCSPSPAGSHMSPEKQPFFYLPWFATGCCSMPSSFFSSPTSLSLCQCPSLTHMHPYTDRHTNQIRTQDTSIQQPKQAEIPKIPLVPEAVRHPTLNSSFTASLQGRASSHHHHHHRLTDSRPDPLMLGSQAAFSKQMPAYKDSHQSSHTEADCAGSPFHSNKGASAEQRLCRLRLHGPQGRLELWGEGEVSEGSCTAARFEVALGMKIYRQGHG